MNARDPEADEPMSLWRWLRWYPLVLALLAAALWAAWPYLAREPSGEPDRVDHAPPPDAEPDPGAPPTSDESEPDGPSLLARGRDRAVALEEAAERVAGAVGPRLSDGVSGLRERGGRDELKAGGLKAARLTPFVGPYLRYQHARDLYATGDGELQDVARRQTVIALAELSLDVGVTGLGRAAAGSEGLLEAMEGVVEAADFADFALSLHGELGSPLGFAGLDQLDVKIDDLAALALIEIGGLQSFVDQLLTVEPPDWLSSLPPELALEARQLLHELLEAARAEH